MSPAALIMMVIAILLIWGGLVAAMVHLRSHPDETLGDETDAPGTVPPSGGTV